jgi:hypothetical protein
MTVHQPGAEGRPAFGVRFMVTPAAAAGSGAASRGGLTFKPGARVDALKPEITRIYPRVEAAWRSHEAPAPVVTSGNDSRHKKGSRHYSDEAIDLRCNNLADDHCRRIADTLQRDLGPDYFVDFERFPKAPANDHIHVEYDPRVRSGTPRRAQIAPTDDLAISDWMRRRRGEVGDR